MTARAHVHPQFEFGGVAITLLREHDDGGRVVFQWPLVGPVLRRVEPEDAYGAPREPESGLTDQLRLPEDIARALYEALAEHFGHSSNDVRALRRDYEAERKRVDRLIGNLIGDTP